MQLTTEQLITIGQWLIFIIVIAVLFYLQSQHNKNVVLALTAALRDFQSSPVAVANAKAAGEGIPQATFDQAYLIMNGLIGLLGQSTPIGQLAQQLENTTKLIDHDPANDPQPDKVSPATLNAIAHAFSGNG
jgi:Trk-type K+ transport system membrane component